MSPSKWLFSQPYALLMLTAIFWGGNAVAGKLAVGHISPFVLTFIRWLVAMAIVYPFAISHLKKDWHKIRKDLPFLIFLGAVGFTVFNNLMYSALVHTSAINVAIIQASMPLMVFALNFLLYRLLATSVQIMGFLLTLIGVLVVATRGNIQNLMTLDFNFGDLLMLIAIMTYGVYSVLLKKKPEMHWLSFIAILGTSALFSSSFFAAWEVSSNTALWPDFQGWMVVLYTAVFPSILSQVFWMRGLEMIGSNRGGVFINLVPIFGSVLAIIILQEQFHVFHALALLLVLGGVWLSQQQKKSKF